MTEIRIAEPADLPRQKALWKLVFGDPDAYIDRFYSHSALGHSLLLEDGGMLCSMVSLLDLSVTLPDGKAATSGYIYALATHPNARGRGFAHALLDHADRFLQSLGRTCVTVVPADPPLHAFYRAEGFVECFATQFRTLEANRLPSCAPADSCVPLSSPAAYNQLRERLLTGTLHVSYPEALIAYQQALSLAGRGGLFQLTTAGQEGAAVVEAGDADTYTIKELLLPNGDAARAVALLAAHLPAAQNYAVRTPAQGHGDRAFGMIKWYAPPPLQTQIGYLGLAFD